MPWLFPIHDWNQDVPEPPHPGSFGFQRKYHTHEGVDLYCPTGTIVHTVESGIVIDVLPFTGAHADSPWWHDTWCVMVRGASGIVNYGELEPLLTTGMQVGAGIDVGMVSQVLKKDKGRPMSMLHLEMYSSLHIDGPVEWKPGAKRPKGLMNPTEFLKGALKI